MDEEGEEACTEEEEGVQLQEVVLDLQVEVKLLELENLENH